MGGVKVRRTVQGVRKGEGQLQLSLLLVGPAGLDLLGLDDVGVRVRVRG